jgi:hypothetical protein
LIDGSHASAVFFSSFNTRKRILAVPANGALNGAIVSDLPKTRVVARIAAMRLAFHRRLD